MNFKQIKYIKKIYHVVYYKLSVMSKHIPQDYMKKNINIH